MAGYKHWGPEICALEFYTKSARVSTLWHDKVAAMENAELQWGVPSSPTL